MTADVVAPGKAPRQQARSLDGSASPVTGVRTTSSASRVRFATDPSHGPALCAAFEAATAASMESVSDEQMLRRVLQAVRRASRARRGAIYLTASAQSTGQEDWLLAVEEASGRTTTGLDADAPFVRAVLCELQRTGAPLIAQNVDALTGLAAGPDPGVESLMAFPLARGDGHLLGVLALTSPKPRAFSARSVGTTRAISHVLELALENRSLRRSVCTAYAKALDASTLLGSVLEATRDGVCVVDRDGVLRLANPTYLRLFGLPRTVIGQPAARAFQHASVRPLELEAFLTGLAELTADPSSADESEWVLPGDPERRVRRHTAPLRNLSGELVGHIEIYADQGPSTRPFTRLSETATTASAPWPRHVPESGMPSPRLRVLVVDDNAQFAASLRETLDLAGVESTLASTPEDAFEHLAREWFDLVLCDHDLGQTTGADLAARLADQSSRVFFAVFTGYAIEVDDPKYMTRGVSAVLPKPVTGRELRQLLDHVVGATALLRV